ncbi:hypothetical protein AB395_00004714 (plasmid) [Sinorhizobium fredii CCBAU 45436]|nr:hypothetical protein AB395_00004714 [Sinorhizobium fredii CCBAU 45436]
MPSATRATAPFGDLLRRFLAQGEATYFLAFPADPERGDIRDCTDRQTYDLLSGTSPAETHLFQNSCLCLPLKRHCATTF